MTGSSNSVKSEGQPVIGVFGLWHLGCVTAACLADAGFETIGVDPDASVVDALDQGKAPLFEPGLDDLIAKGLAAKNLSFSTDVAAVAACDIVWLTFDTPVDDEDKADTGLVVSWAEKMFPHIKDGAVFLISSQLPVGSTRDLAARFAARCPGRTCHFAYSPENLQLGKAIQVFTGSERIIVGVESDAARAALDQVLARFTGNIVWIGIESAEMVKHAINAFLATSVTFANEIATVCERVGADASEVEKSLKLEPRIGPRAYIRPGAPFAGGTLARDIVFLNAIAARDKVKLPLLGGVLASNDAHKSWPIRRIEKYLGDVRGKKIFILGLAYKPGTSTLRRSWALELCSALAKAGAQVVGFDPQVPVLPQEYDSVAAVAADIESGLTGADAAIVATEWLEFRAIDASLCARLMRTPLIVDPNRYLAAKLEHQPQLQYVTVGKP